MSGVEPLNRLDLQENPAFNEQVNPECVLKRQPLEDDVDLFLPLYGIAKLCQLSSEHGLIDGFEQSRPELSMQSDRQVENVSADFIDALQ
jgi:hypothetical protein